MENRCFLCKSKEETISFFIVSKQEFYEFMFYFFLEFIGSFHNKLGKHWKDGRGNLWAKGERSMEDWSIVSFLDCEGEKQDCFRRYGAVHKNAEEFFCLQPLVGD